MQMSATLARDPSRQRRAARVRRWLHAHAFTFAPEQINPGDGLRGALAVTTALSAAFLLRCPELAWAAFAAFWTCLADPGGAARGRLRVMVGFALSGTAAVGLLSTIATLGLAATAVALLLVVGTCTFVGLRGAGTATAGTLVSVAAVVAAEQPAEPRDVAMRALIFVGGSTLALALSLVFSPRAGEPARRAVAWVFHELRDMLAELDQGAGDAHSRERLQGALRRSVRDALERARTQVDKGGIQSSAGRRDLTHALDTADQIFAGMIALSYGLEKKPPHGRGFPRDLLRDLDATLVEAGRLVVKPRAPWTGLWAATERLRMRRSVAGSPARVVDAWVAALDRLATAHAEPGRNGMDTQASAAARRPVSAGTTANTLRRAAVVLLAYLVGHVLALPYVHWTTMAAVVVSHPDASLPWPRMTERILGSVAGGIVAVGLASTLVQPWEQVAIVLPLAAATLALRSVNYTLFVLFLTPLFVMATAVFNAGGGEAAASARVVDNVLGSILALAGCLALSASRPLWSFRKELAQALDANLDYALAVAAPQGDRERTDAARKWAGRCSTAAEQALNRVAVAAPGRRGAWTQAQALLDALRRLAGAAVAVQVASDPRAAKQLSPTLAEVVRCCRAFAEADR